MKEALIGESDVYLGGKVQKVELDSGEMCWGFQFVSVCWRGVLKCSKLSERKKW